VIRVGWIAGEPTPYRAPQLDLVAGSSHLDLTVIYCATTIQRRTWQPELHHRAIFLDGPSLPTTRVLHHDYPVTPGIWRLLERERFDVLVVGGWSLFGAQAAIVWARRRRVPYLLVSESHLRAESPQWVRLLKRAVLPHVVRPAAGHLVTGTLAREHMLAFGADPATIRIFPNTVDVDAFARRVDELRPRREELRRAFAVEGEAPVVLHVGRLIRQKGADRVVAAAERAGLRALVVGDGPQRAELEGRATLTGFLPPHRLVETYVAADVYALLSRRETWGVSVNEAMAAGLPVVLSDAVGAAPDLLEPGGNGELVRGVDEAAAALERLRDDPDTRERYGSRSRELIGAWGYASSVEAVERAVQAAVA
jgi:glycosyltransferase involved in cell wall biosynthesis